MSQAGQAGKTGEVGTPGKEAPPQMGSAQKQATPDAPLKQSLEELRNMKVGMDATGIELCWSAGKKLNELINQPHRPENDTPEQFVQKLGFSPRAVNALLRFFNTYSEAEMREAQVQKLRYWDICSLLMVPDRKERILFQKQIADGSLTANQLERLLEKRRAAALKKNREAHPHSELVQRRKAETPVELVLTACARLCDLAKCLIEGNSLYEAWIPMSILPLRVETMMQRAAAVVVADALQKVLAAKLAILAKLAPPQTGPATATGDNLQAVSGDFHGHLWDAMGLPYIGLGVAPAGANKQKRELSKATANFHRAWRGGLQALHDLDTAVSRTQKAIAQPDQGETVPTAAELNEMRMAVRKAHDAFAAALGPIMAQRGRQGA